MSISKQAQSLNSSPSTNALSHLRELERKEYLRLSDFRASGKNCSQCKKKTQGRFGLIWCDHHDKQVKSYNICAHFVAGATLHIVQERKGKR